MPQPPHPPPAGPAEKLNYGGLAYEVFKVVVIWVVVAIMSATVLRTMHAPGNAGVPLWLQNIYYATNIAVALAAIVALFYAKTQAAAALRQAEISADASKAEVYHVLYRNFISPIFQNGAEEARRLFLLYQAHQAANLTTQTLGDFCAEQILAMETHDFLRFRTLMDFLTFLESVGLQARRGYLSLDDIFYMLKEPLIGFSGILLNYLEARAATREGAWAQAIWLLRTIPEYEPHNRLQG